MQDMKYMFQEINSFNGFIDNLIEHRKELVNLKTSTAREDRHHNEKPRHRNGEKLPLATTTESL